MLIQLNNLVKSSTLLYNCLNCFKIFIIRQRIIPLPQSIKCTSIIFKRCNDEISYILVLLMNIFYTRKTDDVHHLRLHINTLGLTLAIILYRLKSELRIHLYLSFLWIMFRNLIPKENTLEALQYCNGEFSLKFLIR